MRLDHEPLCVLRYNRKAHLRNIYILMLDAKGAPVSQLFACELEALYYIKLNSVSLKDMLLAVYAYDEIIAGVPLVEIH